MPYILQTTGLSKKIGNKTLVTDVDLHIPKGEIYAFLGPNEAGKTTVMKMIMNLWKPTNGLDPAGMKQIRDLLKTLCSEYGNYDFKSHFIRSGKHCRHCWYHPSW